MNRGIPMANSKSNIYPIQLQGAELNLNKYDAEIKQYRGFNKNNSPFVGGCLSNVFTKEEQIEGATDDNTIIDENGDVYRVDTTGLYKNEERLIFLGDGTNSKKFYDNVEIKCDYNTVRVFNEKLWLNRSYGTIDQTGSKYFRLILKVDGVEDPDNLMMFYDPTSGDIENTINEAVKNNIHCVYITEGDKQYAVIMGICETVFGVDRTAIKVIIVDMDTMQVTERYSLYGSSGLMTSEPIAICYNSNAGKLSIFYTIKNTSNVVYQQAVFFSFDSIAGTITGYEYSNSLIVVPTADATHKPLSLNLIDYKVFSHPVNNMRIKNLPPADVEKTDSNKFYFFISLYNMNVNNEGYVSCSPNIRSSYTFNKVYGRTSKNLDQEYNLNKGLLTPIFGDYDYQMCVDFLGSVETYCTSTGGSMVGWNFFEHKTRYVPNIPTETFSKGRFALAKVYKFHNNTYASFRALINNNQLSGISGYNVLFTDWNSVDASSLTYFSDIRNSSCIEKIYYQLGDKWFVIKEGTPKLKRVNNQIVINVDYQQNSYDVQRRKILFFAPRFNGVEANLPSGSHMLYPYQDVSNNFMCAGAINEYAREDNASLILNPFSIHRDGNLEFLDFFFSSLNYPVNFYTNDEDPAKVLYTKTFNAELNKKLAGLPFPTNTDGNIEYSPSIFSEIKNMYGNQVLIKNGQSFYPLAIGNNTEPVMSFFMASGIDNFEEGFIIQGQFYGIINKNIYNIRYVNGVIANQEFIVSVKNLQFVGNTPYEALFFSKTNRCLYSFTGANVLNQKQLVDKISEVRNYLYNPATQTVFLITDIGVLFYGLFGMFLLEHTDITNIFLLNNGIVLSNNLGNYRYIKYYLDEGDTDYTKENINVETSFYGMNNEVVTINDCLYFRIFSEEHEEGDLRVSATTISLSGRKTEETTFKIKASDWDKITHTIYLRYQPKTQRGLGVSFSIDSPFKIASMSVGSTADAILVDKVSKGAVNAPAVTSNNDEW